MDFLLSCYLTVPKILTPKSWFIFRGSVMCVLELLVLMGFLSKEPRSQAVFIENMLLVHVYCKRVGCVNIASRMLLLLSPLYLLTWV